MSTMTAILWSHVELSLHIWPLNSDHLSTTTTILSLEGCRCKRVLLQLPNFWRAKILTRFNPNSYRKTNIFFDRFAELIKMHLEALFFAEQWLRKTKIKFFMAFVIWKLFLFLCLHIISIFVNIAWTLYLCVVFFASKRLWETSLCNEIGCKS